VAPTRAAIRTQKHPGSAQDVRCSAGQAGELGTPLGCGHRRVKSQSQCPRRQALDLLTSRRRPPTVVVHPHCFDICPTMTTIWMAVAMFDGPFIAPSARRTGRHATSDTSGVGTSSITTRLAPSTPAITFPPAGIGSANHGPPFCHASRYL
jgi:hypothetical protein